jgi:surface antigen
MQKHKLVAAGLAATLALTGCANMSREESGQVIGGIAGGVLGSKLSGKNKTALTVAGVLVGAYIGGQIGRQMDEEDRYRAQQALEYNRDNQPATWQNPNTGISYNVTPEKTYYADEGPCREYTTTAIIGGKEEVVYGTACRQADGSWQARN